METDGSRNEYGPVSGRVPGAGSGVDGNHSLFVPLVGHGTGQGSEMQEPPPSVETEPPTESNGGEKILLPVINR